MVKGGMLAFLQDLPAQTTTPLPIGWWLGVLLGGGWMWWLGAVLGGGGRVVKLVVAGRFIGWWMGKVLFFGPMVNGGMVALSCAPPSHHHTTRTVRAVRTAHSVRKRYSAKITVACGVVAGVPLVSSRAWHNEKTL